ncbi:unnamed protein product [Bursaphelenchus xylophilus]|uniref:(pine wood nematode) hypothetical protein n=1 Tax=Bursaphelenchus xylophilus TaxID=6326 RepID=A0A811L4S4_BURXY|nr:unnamed protein product [Bursaphelenchus xylophilus]CAG9109365.1 unnamed protein product [Bursaphelenchus xylophilus]
MIGILVRRTGNLSRFHRVNPKFHWNNRHVCVIEPHRFYAANDRSKVEETLKMLKEDLERQQKEETERKKENKALAQKLPLKTRVIHEIKHYYHGFRLLVLETRLSAKYLYRLARGDTLTRRERQQMVRTVSDLFRLIPFSFFVIVPFMELALPFFIKLFPSMLPSTFQEQSKEKEKIRKQLKIRLEMAKFLQDTLEEIALERRKKEEGSAEKSKAYEFSQFLRKVRQEGALVTNEELFKYAKLFEDELTLDNLSMGQLRALCRMLGVQPLGTPEILRFQLNLKLRELKADDRLIMAEGGVDALSIPDLQQACRQRGMRAIGVSEDRLRSQLRQWLELSQNDKMPPSMLLLSRALFLPEDISFSERLKKIVQQLPMELGEQTKQKLTELEGGKVDPKERMALIRSIEDGLKKERQEAKADAEQKKKAEEDKKRADVEKMEAEKAKIEEEDRKLRETLEVEKPAVDTAKDINEVLQTAHDSVKDLHAEVAKFHNVVHEEAEAEKKAKPAKIKSKELEAVEDVLHGSHINEARHDISELKEKVIEHTEDLIEVNTLADDYTETKVAKRLRARVNSMIAGVDTLVAKLESERRLINNKDGTGKAEDIIEAHETDKKQARLVNIADLLNSLSSLKEASDLAKSTRIAEVLKAMDEDTDGKIDAKLALKVIELLGKHGDVEISSSQMQHIIELMKKESAVEGLQKDEQLQKNGVKILERVVPQLLDFGHHEFPIRAANGSDKTPHPTSSEEIVRSDKEDYPPRKPDHSPHPTQSEENVRSETEDYPPRQPDHSPHPTQSEENVRSEKEDHPPRKPDKTPHPTDSEEVVRSEQEVDGKIPPPPPARLRSNQAKVEAHRL